MLRKSHHVPRVVGAAVGAPADGTVCPASSGEFLRDRTSTRLIKGVHEGGSSPDVMRTVETSS